MSVYFCLISLFTFQASISTLLDEILLSIYQSLASVYLVVIIIKLQYFKILSIHLPSDSYKARNKQTVPKLFVRSC